MYYSVGGKCLWVNYLGGTYRFTDFNTEFTNPPINTVSDATEDTIRAALELYGIELPVGMHFSNNDVGNYTFAADKITMDGSMYDGTISCQYYENGNLGSISEDILQCVSYKDFTVRSEADAYRMIEEGKFKVYSVSNISKIKLGQVAIQYLPDSKGFYQPVYVFEAEINGTSTEIDIPAIE